MREEGKEGRRDRVSLTIELTRRERHPIVMENYLFISKLFFLMAIPMAYGSSWG